MQLFVQWHDAEWYVVTGGALCQTQLWHWTTAWSFLGFSQSYQTNTGHDHFLAHIFQISTL